MYDKKLFIIGILFFLISIYVISSTSYSIYYNKNILTNKIIDIINICVGIFLAFASLYVIDNGYAYNCSGTDECNKISNKICKKRKTNTTG